LSIAIRQPKRVQRAYVSISASDVHTVSDVELLGRLTSRLPFALEAAQKGAWEFQIQHLRRLALDLPDAFFCLELLIPRMGRRADLVLLQDGIVFVIEYKVGARTFDRSSLEQVYGYGLDLKHFHETSHSVPVVPILVATDAPTVGYQALTWDQDHLARPLRATPTELADIVNGSALEAGSAYVDPRTWLAGRYKPTPTIVEAAQALYRGHGVEEISRSEAGATNLTRTADFVGGVIDRAKRDHRKVICFITGVPGSGKTLAGLNLATSRQRLHDEEHAVFLSGNGPLVAVLREALAVDGVVQARAAGVPASKAQEARRASAFIQNIHHFRDDALTSDAAPIEKVAIFDEAQRAWDADQTAKFMQQKRGQIGFSLSEPEFLLGVMDRHSDWCAIVCLVGGGQEINTGEAGIQEWLASLDRSYLHWDVYMPPGRDADSGPTAVQADDLHLATSIRSFRSEKLSDFVGEVVGGNAPEARRLSLSLQSYPLLLTRDLNRAREWLRSRRRGNERAGLLASSNGARLKPHGVFVKAAIEPEKWFLAPAEDVRSSGALEDVATEFDVQGLELDWACVCWDANFRRSGGEWATLQFKGTAWQTINDVNRQRYVANSYRVLLTRARQGLVVFVPEGSAYDGTRPPRVYDEIASFLAACGLQEL
jgi:hypothetical protein